MPRVFIGVGANLDAERNVAEALRRLSALAKLVAVSMFYRTPAEDRPDQPDFVNGVVELDCSQAPAALKSDLRSIEEALGRSRSADRSAPRPIDLDILLFGDQVLEGELTVPDPSIERRAFLAVPLAELAPELRLPTTGEPIRALARRFASHGMIPLPRLTAQLRASATR